MSRKKSVSDHLKPKLIAWQPSSFTQKALVDCTLPEVFFGGARGGGKTDGVIGKWGGKALSFGSQFNALAVRRTTVSFEDTVQRMKTIYSKIGGKLYMTGNRPTFFFDTGGRISLRYLETDEDAEEYQGGNYSDLWVEEVGQYPSPSPIFKLFGLLRAPDVEEGTTKIYTQMILTGNPGGAGQHWIASRYKLIPFPEHPMRLVLPLPTGRLHEVAVIPSRVKDNPYLGDDYIDKLHMVGSPELVKAWLDGDWTAIEGAFFPEFSEVKHVLTPFTIPEEWVKFRSIDWGSATPFSVGWWVIVPDDFEHDGKVIPRGSIIRYREWYGATKGAVNKGLKMTAEEVADGILEREHINVEEVVNGYLIKRTIRENITYTVIDPSAFAQQGGPSIAERMSRKGIAVRPADNKRIGLKGLLGGWDMVRHRLKGQDGIPRIYFFNTCKDLIRTLPALQHSPKRPEDVDTEMEDHAPDECRYACMSRPFVPNRENEIDPIHSFASGQSRGNIALISGPTFNEMMKQVKKAREEGFYER